MDPRGGGTRRPGLGAVVLAVCSGTLAIIVLIYASQPQDAGDSTTTTSNLVVAPPETITPSTLAEVADPPTLIPLTDFLPDLEGELMTVVTTGTDNHHLVAWSQSRSEAGMPPMLDRPDLEFDAADLRIAFLGPSSVPEGYPLYVGRPLNWQSIASRVTSFAWHTSLPGRLGWMEFGRGLCQADLHVNGAFVTEPTCAPDLIGELSGLDENGALLVNGGEIIRISPDGEEVRRLVGTKAFLAPDGRVLITSLSSAERGVVFDLATPDLSDVERLEWAPPEALGLYGFVAWSPRATSLELAFLVSLDEGRHQIQRWDLDGNLLNSLNMGGEVWDVGWDRSGRYLLAPGLVEGEYVIHAYDLSTLELTFLPFDHSVEDTQLVIPALCEDASPLVDHWHERVPDGVTVVDMWMVSSRDSGLVSWRFVSGRLLGGDHDGEIATWAIPDYSGAGAPPQAIPANEAAIDPGQEPSPLDQSGHGVDDWMLVDGARISQWCLGASDD